MTTTCLEMLHLSEARHREIDRAASRPRSGWSPDGSENWWWLWLPAIYAAAIIMIFRVNEPIYFAWFLPEGYGVLELSQFFLAAAGFVLAIRLLFRTYVRDWPLLKWAVLLFALACFYIAGEEHSWGQHFFHWETPKYWSALNRQNETNLHNTFNLANYLPSVVLELGVLLGGILMPLYEHLRGRFRHGLLKLFTPPIALMPAALCAAAFKFAKVAGNDDISPLLVPTPNEAVETFLYLFVFFYLVVFARRVSVLETTSRGG